MQFNNTHLNGFPVTAHEVHANCVTVMCIRDPENAPNHKSLVVATWSPETGDGWMWGHYFHGDVAQDEAQADFHETARRNAKR